MDHSTWFSVSIFSISDSVLIDRKHTYKTEKNSELGLQFITYTKVTFSNCFTYWLEQSCGSERIVQDPVPKAGIGFYYIGGIHGNREPVHGRRLLGICKK